MTTIREAIHQHITVIDDCWIWSGRVQTNGYGVIRFDGRDYGVGKALFEQHYECVIGRTKLKHACGRRDCVNPEHARPFSIDFSLMRSFWASVKRDDATGCWLWQGSCALNGYGVVAAKVYVHRFVFDYIYGLPDGLEVCHRCDNPPCCNPFHLFSGTHADNMRDMSIKLRAAKSLLTAEQVNEIRDSSESGTEIATRLQVSPYVVSDVKRGRSYKYV